MGLFLIFGFFRNFSKGLFRNKLQVGVFSVCFLGVFLRGVQTTRLFAVNECK